MTTRTLDELARACGASLEGDATLAIRGPAALRDAERDEISFCTHSRLRAEVEKTRAGAVVVPRDFELARRDLALLRSDQPNLAFDAIVELFAPAPPRALPGIHPSAVVDPSAVLESGVSVGPLCRVARGARIGARTVLRARVDVGEDCAVGEDCDLHPGVVLYPRVAVGARCILQAGVVLGADGHGYQPGQGGWIKIRQSGTVVLEDEVEIGANSTVDRARFGVTRIGRGTKIDNLVQIAHNVVIGPGSMIVAQVGIAGSTRIGRGVVIGGQVGIGGHLDIGDGVQIGGQSGVTGSWPAGVELWGYPARPIKEALRSMAFSARGDDVLRRLRELEQRLDRLAPETRREHTAGERPATGRPHEEIR